MTEPRPIPDREQGMILINVLLFVAIASGILLLMITAEDAALDRSIRMREAARAQAIARGGEISAIVALRRDGLLSPETDNRTEAWAALEERAAPIAGGSFDLAIADAESRFNVNALIGGDPVAVAILTRVAAQAGIGASEIPPAIALMREIGPLTDLAPLRSIGLNDRQLASLRDVLTALPADARINLNAVNEPTLALLLDSPVTARQLIAIRERRGFLTPADLHDIQVSIPANAGFTSNLFWVRTRARIGGTSQQLTSLLLRKRAADGSVVVLPIGRWAGASAPDQAPTLP